MSPATRRTPPAALLALVACLGLTGCSTTTKPAGTGDVRGLRLGVFASDRGNAGGQYDLYLWYYDELKFRDISQILKSAAVERHPSISSDGLFIAFQVDRGGGAGNNIEIYYRYTQKLVDLPGLNTADSETEPAFTGDGKKLCFTQGTSRSRIRLYDSATKQRVALPGLDTTSTAPYSDYSPAPNHDGSLIAFVSDRNGGPDIFIYDRARKLVLDGPNLRTALVSSANDVDPSFSSSGRFLTFASNRAGSSYDVYLLEFVTTQTRVDTLLRDVTLANSGYDERHPGVNDTGTELVFQSNRITGQGQNDLWNFDRNANQAPTQSPGYDSPGDDIEVSLKWPY